MTKSSIHDSPQFTGNLIRDNTHTQTLSATAKPIPQTSHKQRSYSSTMINMHILELATPEKRP
jgi:hypothetical protein